MRLFIALEMDPEPQKRLATACDGLRRRVRGGHVAWVKPDNLHITLRFLGDTSPEEAQRITEVLGEVRAEQCPFEPVRWGAFPSLHRPRVVWAGMEEGQETGVIALAKMVEERLQYLGMSPEEKPFRAHVTVGRVKSPAHGLEEAVRDAPLQGVGLTVPKRFVLMESRLRPGGSEYAVLAEFPLER